jgi:hypothetical protein
MAVTEPETIGALDAQISIACHLDEAARASLV